MKRYKRIYILLGVLLAVCIATVAAVKYEERQEQIRTSEEVILSLSADEVQSLSWSYEAESLSFSRGEDGLWYWDDDAAFPVSGDKIAELLDTFANFSVSFAIDDVEDESLYGLAEPVCTIFLSTADASYTVKLGDFSKLDSQRYVSVGDGRAYLVSSDPMETFELTIRDMIENDPALDYDAVTAVSIAGSEDWSFSYTESGSSLCAEDRYFTEGLPLDTYRVDDYLGSMSLLELTNYTGLWIEKSIQEGNEKDEQS